MFTKYYKDTFVVYKNNVITVGNKCIERIWTLDKGIPVPVSIINKEGEHEWCESIDEGIEDVITSVKYSLQLLPDVKPLSSEIDTVINDDLGTGLDHLKISLILHYEWVHIKWDICIYPELPVIRTRFSLRKSECKKTLPDDYVQRIRHAAGLNEKENSFIDCIRLNGIHARWKLVTLRAVSDYNSNLLSEDHGLIYSREKRWLNGNILFIKQTLGDHGIIIIKESPNLWEQVKYPGADFYMRGKNILVSGSTISLDEMSSDTFTPLYGSAVCVWKGDEFERLQVLRQYHEVRHKFNPSMDCTIMGNTWGDCSRETKICESFIMDELEAAAKIGLTHYTIDDGWQTIDESSKTNKNIWIFNKTKFPNGMESIKALSEKLGVRLCLWYRPYSPNNFEEWEKDSSILIELHRQYGITHFKFDGFWITSSQGEENLVNMMRRVIADTNNGVSFNIDVTNRERLGYFGQTQYGTIFVENRYTDWRNYYPHYTLRTLWLLSRYIPSYRLQMEFLNVDRNTEKYNNDPLAPHKCGIAYSFAAVMFSQPLAWFEATGLSVKNTNCLKDIIRVYRHHQEKILSGLVLPIGEEPDGTKFTGFQSILSEKDGYLLILREMNDGDTYSYLLWGDAFKAGYKKIFIEKLVGEGQNRFIDINGDGKVEFQLSKPFSYGLYRYELK